MSGYLIWTRKSQFIEYISSHGDDIVSSKRIEDIILSKKSPGTFHKIKIYLVNALNDFSYLWYK